LLIIVLQLALLLQLRGLLQSLHKADGFVLLLHLVIEISDLASPLGTLASLATTALLLFFLVASGFLCHSISCTDFIHQLIS